MSRANIAVAIALLVVLGALIAAVPLPYWPHIAAYTLALGSLGIVIWLPGFVIEQTMLRKFELGGLRTLARFCLGLGFWVAVLFLLCALRHLTASVLWVVIGLVVIATLATCVLRRAWNPGRWHWPVLQLSQLPAAIVVGILLVPCFIMALGPHLGWDDNVYHLTLPKLFLAHGGFRPVPFSIYSNWPLNTELLFAMAMLVKDYILAKLVHFGFGLLTLYAIGVTCREFNCGKAAGLAMVLFLANGVVASELAVAYVDLACAFFLLAGCVFMLRAVDDPGHRRGALLLSGLCCGLLAGTKLTGIVGAAIIAGLYLVRLRPRREVAAQLGTLLAWFGLPTLALWLPWLVKAAYYTGNPVYPLAYGWFGGTNWSPTLADQFTTWQRSIGMGRAPLDYLVLPIRVILAAGPGYPYFDGHINAVWFVLLPIALGWGLKHRLVRYGLAVAGVYFVHWSLSSQQMRLLLPVLPLLAIAASATVAALVKRIQERALRRAAVGACLLVIGIAGVYENRVQFSGAPRVAQLFALRGTALRDSAVPPTYAFINDNLPKDARVLCLNVNHGFLLDREYLADSCFEASQIADWLGTASSVAEVRRRLAERGITHVLAFKHDWGIRYPSALRTLLDDRRETTPLYQSPDGQFRVLALRGGISLRDEGLDPLCDRVNGKRHG